MHTMSTRLRVALALLVAVAITPALSGCFFNPGSIVERVVEGATGGDVDLGGSGELPNGFPTDQVPVIDGEVIFGAKVSSGGETAWNVSMSTQDANALQAVSTQLADAGFSKEEASMVGDDGSGFAAFTKGDLGVAIVVTKGEDGIVVNYTVTQSSK